MANDQDEVNCYRDVRRLAKSGHGLEIAAQRLDSLDKCVLHYVTDLRKTRADHPALVLELGCGSGGLTKTIAGLGAEVLAIDKEDYEDEVLKNDVGSALTQQASIRFFRASLPTFPSEAGKCVFDCVVSQRALHYLRYEETKAVLVWCRQHMRADGRLFLGVSGLGSELGFGYAHSSIRVQDRWARLSRLMANKHGIEHEVCLYTEGELCALAEESGLRVEDCWKSNFGNIKLIGSPT